MSTNSDRLAAYIAAEAKVLQGQEVRLEGPGGYRMWRGADLQELRAEIKRLQASVAAENAASSGAPRIGGLGFAVGRFDCQ